MYSSFIFYEKTGCSGNARQKQLLKSYGLNFEVRSLLDNPWTKEELGEFFKDLENTQFTNQFAPKIKNRELDVTTLSKDELIELMIKEPILIKRPLIAIDSNRVCGFDIEKLNSILNINIDANRDISTCQSSDPCKSV